MKKNSLKHLTVTGFATGTDLSDCDLLESKHKEAKDRLKLAEKDVKDAKQKLNLALEEKVNKIENRKKKIKETQSNLVHNPASSSAINIENIKSKYDEAMLALELRKNEIKKKIEDYSEGGTENWDSFKQILNQDLEELGTALNGFLSKISR